MKKTKKRGILILALTFLFLIFFLSFLSSYFSLTGKVIQEESSVDADGTIWVDKLCFEDRCVSSAEELLEEANYTLPNSFELEFSKDWIFYTQSRRDQIKYSLSQDSRVKGSSSLKIEFDGNGPLKNDFWLQHMPIRVIKGKKYIFSVFAKTDIPDFSLELQIRKTERNSTNPGVGGEVPEIYTKRFKLDNSFKKYSIEIPETSEGAYSFEIKGLSSKKGNLYLDSAGINGILLNFKRDLKADASLVTSRIDGIYYKNERISITAKTHFYKVGNYEINYEIHDFYDEIVQQGILFKGSAKTNSRQEKTISPELNDYGIYKAKLFVKENNKIVAETETIFSIVPKAENSEFMGGHIYSWSDTQIESGRKLGVKWLRNHDMMQYTHWRTVQPTNNNTWVWYDSEIQNLTKKGFKILGSLERLPNWAIRPGLAPGDYSSQYSYPEGHIEEYKKYVYETVKHYSPWIKYWEVWNEPYPSEIMTKEQYLELLKITYTEAKKADPEAKIIGMGGGMSLDLWNYTFSNGGGNYMDFVSIHNYVGLHNPEGAEEDIIKTYQGIMLKNNAEKEIWDSESGLHSVESLYNFPAVKFHNFYGEKLTNTKPLTIGLDFNGLIDEVRIYNKKLTEEQISQRYKNKVDIREGLVGEWSFNSISDNKAEDNSGMENHGTIYGASLSNECIVGSCLQFGGNSYVQIPHSDSLNLSDGITLEAWLKPTAQPKGAPGFTQFLAKGNSYYSGYGLYIADDYDLIFQLTGENANSLRTSSSKTAPLNKWTHVVATFDDKRADIYIDAVMDRGLYEEDVESSVEKLVKTYTLLRSFGVKKSFYYLTGNPGDFNPRLELFALEYDGKPKPMAVAYSIFAWLIGDSEYKEKDVASSVSKYKFEDAKKQVIVAWAEEPSEIEKPAGFEAYSSVGKKLASGTSSSPISVGEIPVYLVRWKT